MWGIVACPIPCLDYRGMFCKGRVPFQKPILRNDAFKLASFKFDLNFMTCLL